jgi:hypothetical protein
MKKEILEQLLKIELQNRELENERKKFAVRLETKRFYFCAFVILLAFGIFVYLSLTSDNVLNEKSTGSLTLVLCVLFPFISLVTGRESVVKEIITILSNKLMK